MRDQSKYEPLERSEFFENQTSWRPLVDGVVPRAGYASIWHEDDLRESRPAAITRELLERGRERFSIYCSVCHGQTGYGRGIVVQRGYPAPASFHTDRLRSVPDEHIFQVITNGLGKMPPYRQKVTPADRWAIISYVRALQLSQHAPAGQLPAELLERLNDGEAAAP